MQYLITFLEGVITFVSPCLLPMLPIYVFYFTGGDPGQNRAKAWKNALGFVVGFTLVFVALGAFAGTVGLLLKRYQTAVNLITGAVVVLFGLNFLGVLRIPGFNGPQKQARTANLGFGSSVLFGIVFSIGWTPCVGAFLGSALMLASQQGSAFQGILLLLCYSLGLGIPFLVSALLLDQLKGAFDFIKRHYTVVNRISGILLIVVGVLMMTGMMGYFLSLLSF